jgi:hypothetical protein
MVTDFTNKSTNIIQFNDLLGANIADFVFANSTVQISPVNGPYISSTVDSIDPVANTITLTDHTWLTYGNVAVVTGQSGSNVINMVSLTGSYDIVNNAQYSNTAYPLMDIVYAGDTVLVANNTVKTVQSIDYEHGRIYLTTNLTSNTSSLMSVNRTLSAQTAVTILGPIGLQYTPQLATQDGQILITEDGNIILLG